MADSIFHQIWRANLLYILRERKSFVCFFLRNSPTDKFLFSFRFFFVVFIVYVYNKLVSTFRLKILIQDIERLGFFAVVLKRTKEMSTRSWNTVLQLSIDKCPTASKEIYPPILKQIGTPPTTSTPEEVTYNTRNISHNSPWRRRMSTPPPCAPCPLCRSCTDLPTRRASCCHQPARGRNIPVFPGEQSTHRRERSFC